MKRFSSFLTCFAILPLWAFAQEQEDPGYETARTVQASKFLPAEAFEGPRYKVASRAANDGMRNTYYIVGGGQVFQVTGSEFALERLRELIAIDKLKEVSDAKALGEGLMDSVEDRAKAVSSAVVDPVGTVKNVPKGASRWFGHVRDGIKQMVDQPEGEELPTGGRVQATLESAAGVARRKREYAAELGVDVYSSNPTLQAELDRVTKVASAASLGVDIGTAAVGGLGGDVLMGINLTNTLEQTLKNSTPQELARANRKALLALGTNEDLIAELLQHPWYTPRTATILTDALSRIGVNPDLFLTQALQALTPDDAHFFQRSAQLLAECKKQGAELIAYRQDQRIVGAVDNAGTFIVPVSLDYAIWTPSAEKRVDALAALAGKAEGIKAVEIWTEGQFSPKAAGELSKRGIGYKSLAIPPESTKNQEE